MESYSGRTNVLQHRAQAAFKGIMEEATGELGLRRVDWLIQQGGDGELAILPPGTSERVVVSRLAPIVDRLLREHNQGLASEAKVRLRIAVHQGLVHLDGANGFPSEAIVHVCRLVDSPQLKAMLRRFPGANVALIISDSLYHDVVRHYQDLRPEQFACVSARLPEKNFNATAWIYVPGENAAELAAAIAEIAPARASGGVDRPASPPAEPRGGSQTFRDINTNGPAMFGNHNTLDARGYPAHEPGPHE
ncbi:hypothetical protein WEI85_23705 [Actinomycetes bacterium KLBMP 9797]